MIRNRLAGYSPGSFSELILLSDDYAPASGQCQRSWCERSDRARIVPFFRKRTNYLDAGRSHERNRTGGPRDGACRYPGSGTAMQLSRLSPLFRSLSLRHFWCSHSAHPAKPPPSLILLHLPRVCHPVATVACALPFYVIRPSPSIFLDLRLAPLFKCHLVND